MITVKKLLIAALGTFVIAASAFAQDSKSKSPKPKIEKTEEVIIKKDGDTKEKMTIVVDGDNVTINGKPVDEFENKHIIIMKKGSDMNAPHVMMRKFKNRDMEDGDEEDFDMHSGDMGNKAMLGVMTEKAADGVKINNVTKESGAEKAGLKEGDVITKVGAEKIATPEDLIKAIKGYKPNDKVDITYNRSGKENKASATLGENKTKAYAFNFNGDFNGDDFAQLMPHGKIPGMENFNFEFDRKPKIGLQIQDVEDGKGVSVKDVDEDTPAAKSGLKEGDIITQVNGKDISGVDELKESIKNMKEGDSVKLTYKRNGASQTTDIKIPKKLKTVDL